MNLICLELLLQNTNTCTPAGLQLKEYGNSHACVENLREQIRVIEAFITFLDSEVERKKYETLHSKTEEELADLAFSNLNENSGPVSCSLIPILEANRITSRPYHGGAFTGNHCHKYVSKKV